MSRVTVVHTTAFTYSEPITESVMEVRLEPAAGFGQLLLDFKLSVMPRVAVGRYMDGFGNAVHHFTIQGPHRRLKVIAHSVVETPPAAPAGDPEGGLVPSDLLRFRPPVVDVGGVRRLARRYRAPAGAPVSAVVAALDALAEGISREFTYDTQSTDVSTAVDRVLQLKAGVCQDFAHLFIAVARAMDVPTRYVSGYVHDGNPGTRVGASHAWAEAWLPGLGWIGYDATHPIRTGPRHIRVAVGRDYRDAAPTRGVYVGAAVSQMEVTMRTRLERDRGRPVPAKADGLRASS